MESPSQLVLADGERVIWTGRPQPEVRISRLAGLLAVWLTVPIYLASDLFGWFVMGRPLAEGNWTLRIGLLTLLGLTGPALIRVLLRRRRDGTAYAITTKRLVVVTGGRVPLRVLPLAAVRKVELRGDLVAIHSGTTPWTQPDNPEGLSVPGPDIIEVLGPIEDAGKLAEAIREAQGGPGSSWRVASAP